MTLADLFRIIAALLLLPAAAFVILAGMLEL